jgi:hypothetical protein
MAHQVVFAKEEVQLVRIQRCAILQVDVHGVQRDVQVAAPVVHLGDVRLDQRIVNGQGVKAEDVG